MAKSRLFDYFNLRWIAGTIEIETLEAAVVKGYITQEEFQEIISQ